MKSFSKVFSHFSQPQVDTWNPSELDVELAVPPQEVQNEQILAIFDSEDSNLGRQEKVAQSALHPMGRDLVVNNWQPANIDTQPPLVVTYQWNFIDTSSGNNQNPEQEIWEDESNSEKDAVTILKQARAQAEEIIREAQVEADRAILQAQDEIDLQKKEGYQRGWTEARNEMGEALKAAHAMVEEVHEWQTSLIAQGEQVLTEMLKEISQTMFGEGANLDANALRINLNRIMESAQGLGDLNIFLNPRDAKLLDPSWSEYQLLISGNKVRIIPSEKVTSGGCMVKGNMGTVDARVETQLAAIINAFEEIEETT